MPPLVTVPKKTIIAGSANKNSFDIGYSLCYDGGYPIESEDIMIMPDSDAKKRWKKENLYMVCLNLHRKNDEDVVEFLDSKGADKQKYIKAAVREYIANHPEEKDE